MDAHHFKNHEGDLLLFIQTKSSCLDSVLPSFLEDYMQVLVLYISGESFYLHRVWNRSDSPPRHYCYYSQGRTCSLDFVRI